MTLFVIYIIGLLALIGFYIGYAIKNPRDAAENIKDCDDFSFLILFTFIWPVVIPFAATWVFCTGLERIQKCLVDFLEKRAENKEK